MSFQDFGKKGNSRPSNASRMGVSNGFGNGSLASASQSGIPSRQDDYTSVSQSILQYQVWRRCGLLYIMWSVNFLFFSFISHSKM